MRKALVFASAVFFFTASAYADCGRPEKKFTVTPREILVGNDGDFRLMADVAGGEAPFTYQWKVTVGGEEYTSNEKITPIFKPYADRYAEIIVRDRGGCEMRTTFGKQIFLPKKPCSLLAYSPMPTPGAVQSSGVEIAYAGGGVKWRVALENRGLKGVALGLVQMQRPGETNWNTILKAAGPTEIFVPYHNGSTRLYDMRYCGASTGNPHPCLREVKMSDTSSNFLNQATLITFPGSAYPTVAAECRDEGLAALCKTNAGNVESGYTVRYKEVVFWSVYDTGNYDYVVQYGFRNDGTIRFRMGATGYNNQDHPDDPHMHDVLWRVDADLFGAKGDGVAQFAHHEPAPSLTATDSHSHYGTEGKLNWSDAQFTSLLVESGVANAHGSEMAYELTPWDRKGTAKHHDAGESWTREDFWVTINHQFEDGTAASGPNSWGTNWLTPDQYVMRYASENASLTPNSGPETLTALSDIVVWYRSAAHHHPRDEDRRDTDFGATITGLTLMHWQGFDFEPHNIFNNNPLIPSASCHPN